MSADNYYVITRHPLGGYTAVMGFASDDSNRPATEQDPQFATLDDALTYALNDYTEYGVSVDPDCEPEPDRASPSPRPGPPPADAASLDFRDGLLTAARWLRQHPDTPAALLAADLEDLADATTDPATCPHPFWNPHPDGTVTCRSCHTDVTGREDMGG
jgi:hypothetical protein